MRMTWAFGHGNAPRAPVIVALLVLLNALLVRASDPDALVRLRDLAFDSYQRIKPRVVPDDLPVRIVDIDEAALQERRGTIDKYMGDAIMAFWNAPLTIEGHAAHACEAALAMQARLVTLNEEWKAEAEAEGRSQIPVNIGIGLNTGHASVGNFGSEQRLTYSCLGDEVNLASRLEGQCKTYVVGITVGENTVKQVPDFATLELDLEALERVDGLNGAAVAAGWKQGYYDMMRERIEGLIDDSPPDWNGVYVAKEK